MAKIGKQREFNAALKKIRGEEIDVSEEAAGIREYIETPERLPKARLIDLFQSRYLSYVIVVYERVRNEMRGEMDAKATEMEAKHQQMREEMDAKVAAIDAKQQQIDAKYEAMEKMYATLQNMMGN
ncbi:unnamed protein product [Lactuca virosa]|uniref:Uncharacterized protein n=1 Tax=Lactuca virosa TaxID=75947 RepID=A0AAU9PU09_9ASTR|nr:unnamed protein product [Lactuca virosa]